MNSLQLAFRRIRRTPLHSLIMVASLTLGLAGCLLLSMFVINERSYDRSWEKGDRIYRVLNVDPVVGKIDPGCPNGLGPGVTRTIPGVESFCRLQNSEQRVKIGENPEGVLVPFLTADTTVFSILNIKPDQGRVQYLADGASTVFLTRTFSDRYFKGQNPAGKTLHGFGPDSLADHYFIAGIIPDLPKLSHLRAEILKINLRHPDRDVITPDGGTNYEIQYLLLQPGVDANQTGRKISAWYKSQLKVSWRVPEFRLQPMKDIYLKSDFAAGQLVRGNGSLVNILSIVAILLLVIGCVNFVNLSTAFSLNRAPSTGLRKILGAGKSALFGQFITESGLFFIASLTLGLAVTILGLPWMERFTGHPLGLHLSGEGWIFALAALGIVMVAGIYPAVVLSRPSAKALRMALNTHGAGFAGVRNALVIAQFFLAAGLLVMTTGVQRQVNLLLHAPLGFDADRLLVVRSPVWGPSRNAFKTAVQSLAGVESTSYSGWYPTMGPGGMSRTVKDAKDPSLEFTVNTIFADPSLAQTMGMKLLAGRWLDPSRANDMPNLDSMMFTNYSVAEDAMKIQSTILTASSARRLGVKELGRPIHGMPGIPVGIVADFHNLSLKQPLGVTEVRGSYTENGDLLVRCAAADRWKIQAKIAAVYKKMYSDSYYDASILEEDLARQYADEKKLQSTLLVFSGLGIGLACLGLLGLTSFLLQSRVKEIGIRKVLGATLPDITGRIIWQYLRWIIVASLLAFPVSGWLLSGWLQDYDTHIGLTLGLFFQTLIVVSSFALLFTIIQTLRAARANPIRAIRQEN